MVYVRMNVSYTVGQPSLPIFRIVMFATMLLILNLLWLKSMLIGASIPFLGENTCGIVE